MTKLTRKERRERKKRSVEVGEVETPEERACDQILMQERTKYLNDEGYHFIRPAWHRWVYGGGEKDK